MNRRPDPIVSVAVVGGGINGSGVAWELVRRGYRVTLYDKGAFGAETSSATSKLIHGGLRYLEQFEFGLVRESLRERAFLLQHVPDLVRPLEFVLPIYKRLSRPAWMIRFGLILYDLLAGRDPLPRHTRLTGEQVLSLAPLKRAGLNGGFRYFDAQVDDAGLVRRVIAAARRDGLDAREHSEVTALARTGGGWQVNSESFDAVIVAAGPWMNEFLKEQGIESDMSLALSRGSHIYIDRLISSAGFLLQSPGDRRVFFVLPWKDQTMIGTTEVLHRASPDEVRTTSEEIDYLIERFNFYFEAPISRHNVVHTTAGVRPLIDVGEDLGAASREYRIEADGTLIKVFGGKMTTFMALSRKVADRVDAAFGQRRKAKPPVF